MLLQGGVFLPDPAERDQARGRMSRGGDAVVIIPAENDGISAPIPRLDNADMAASPTRKHGDAIDATTRGLGSEMRPGTGNPKLSPRAAVETEFSCQIAATPKSGRAFGRASALCIGDRDVTRCSRHIMMVRGARNAIAMRPVMDRMVVMVPMMMVSGLGLRWRKPETRHDNACRDNCADHSAPFVCCWRRRTAQPPQGYPRI